MPFGLGKGKSRRSNEVVDNYDNLVKNLERGKKDYLAEWNWICRRIPAHEAAMKNSHAIEVIYINDALHSAKCGDVKRVIDGLESLDKELVLFKHFGDAYGTALRLRKKEEEKEQKESKSIQYIQHNYSNSTGYQVRAEGGNNQIGSVIQPLRAIESFRDVRSDEWKLPVSPAYDNLDNYLKNQRWKEADDETYQLIMNLEVGGENPAFGDLRYFPDEVLRTIDRLWVMHSDGRFGFSVQKKIYLRYARVLGERVDQDAVRALYRANGWMVNEEMRESAIFSIQSPQGHLPAWGTSWFGMWWSILLHPCL